ncbi:MAG TPA: DUF4347 domain-containing protein [Pyrinomonadaceae bacterium]|nr:DUF4347 domain-containing protein [Pyrinomonadaceae bacterium]
MISIEQPALAVHSHDVPGYKYKMDYTVKLDASATIETVVMQVLISAKKAGGKLKNLVINSHGSPGHLYVGENNTINFNNLSRFRVTNITQPLIDRIWIVACEVAGYHRQIVNLGFPFCSELAKAAGCEVVASNRSQYVNPGFYLRFCPKNHIDNYEGEVWLWDKNGKRQSFNPNGF